MKKKLLFICSGNLDRSPTAEKLFRNSEIYEAKSAGTHPDAIIKVSQNLIDWADVVFVMSEREDGHLTFLKQNFNIKEKKIFDLDISDVYDRDDPELIKLIADKLETIYRLSI